MSEAIHPAAPDHLPSFITAPGETDVLMVVMAIVLLLFVLMVGVLYFRLHALPERFAHKKVQFEIVCVLALLAMFTHMHIFWIAGLLLALIDFPDFSGLFGRIAGSTERIAAKNSPEGADQSAPSVMTVIRQRQNHYDRDEGGTSDRGTSDRIVSRLASVDRLQPDR
jgi:hypothetical protein